MDPWVANGEGDDDRDRWDADADRLLGPDDLLGPADLGLDPDDPHRDPRDDHEDPDDDLSALAFEERYDPEVLAAIEARAAGPSEPVSRISQWTRRSAVGALFTGMALGLQEVFDPKEQQSIVVEVDDEGVPNDLPVQMFLDPDSPAGSLCIIHRTDVPPPVV